MSRSNDDDGSNDDGSNDDGSNDYLISKHVTIESINIKVDVIIKEFFTTKAQNIFTWPASYLLASYIVANGRCLFNDKRIVEIGSGTGLPSIVAASFAQAKSCILTERDDEPKVLNNLNDIITMNNVDTICRTMPLSWGPISDNKLKYLECDYVFGADVFYLTEDFNNIFLTVASIMTMNENTIFLTTYQERSIKRTIRPYLDFYSLDAVIIPRSTFLHEAHSIGYCQVVHDTNTNTRLPSKRKVNDNDDTDIIRIQTYDNIYMIKIFLRK